MNYPILVGAAGAALALGLCTTAAAAAIDLTTLTPGAGDGAAFHSGAPEPGYAVTASPNTLSIVSGPNLPVGTQSTHNVLYLPTLGDFLARVTVTATPDSLAGFYADVPAGFAGLQFGSTFVRGSYGGAGGSVDTPDAAVSGGPVIFQLSRIGNDFTASYSADGGAFTTLFSLSSPNVGGAAGFDLTSYGFTQEDGAHTDTFSNFTISSIVSAGVPEPAAWAMMIAGFGLAGASLRRNRGRVAAS